MTLARVDDEQTALARRVEHALRRRDRLRRSETSLPSVSPNPPGSTKSRCMSMMTSAVVDGANANRKVPPGRPS